MLTAALLCALVVPVQDRVPEITLGRRTAAITEPFSDAMGMAEMSDGRVIVSDRVEAVFSLADFRSGSRRTIGRNGSGPNEYQFPYGPIRWLGDTLLGSDTRNQRLLKIAPAARVEILDTHGKLRAQLRLPPRARLFALGSRHVYLLLVDDDGLQTLERYDYPVFR